MLEQIHDSIGAPRRSRTSWRLRVVLGLVGLVACGPQDDSPDTGYTPNFVNMAPVQYTLNEGASGVLEIVNNIANLTIVSNDTSVLKAEYQAGFVQGHMQGTTILSARDNALELWQPSTSDLTDASSILNANYDFMVGYLQANPDAESTQRLTRLLFRLLGIYHGVTLSQPASLDFSGSWLPASSTFEPAELTLGYRTSGLTFMDLYFVNSTLDLEDVLYYGGTSAQKQTTGRMKKPDWPLHCSAFVKRTADDIIIAHATWSVFLAQTMSMTINVNGDMMTINAYTPGQISSVTDFGYNNKGMMFNETTHAYSYTEARTNAIWMFWRAALAEQFSGSIDEFFENISLDNSGTYLNGYMLVDANTRETGLVDMSYKTFVLFRSSGGAYTYTTKPAGLSTDYDAVMLTPDYIMGYNYPVSTLIRDELHSSYDSPRRAQLQQLLPTVTNLEIAKAVITYFDPTEAGSIFSRYDLSSRSIPFGAIDAKVADVGMARAFMQVAGDIDMKTTAQGYWMLFGTAHIDGWPFVWSQSEWSNWSHPDVPDAVDGKYTHLNFFLR